MLVLNAERIESAVEMLRKKGVPFNGEIVEVLQGKFIGFEDPDGNPIELVQQNRA
jgi:hypothetical protein